MKSMFMFLVSMFILVSCDYGLNFDWGQGNVPPGRTCYDFYKATITVEYESGEPCISAYACIMITKNRYRSSHADSTGMIKLLYEPNCDEYDINALVFPCDVYRAYPSDSISINVIWSDVIQMFKSDSRDGEWPEPYIEIVIPDSLAQ